MAECPENKKEKIEKGVVVDEIQEDENPDATEPSPKRAKKARPARTPKKVSRQKDNVIIDSCIFSSTTDMPYTCFVPGCTSGYESNPVKVPMFSVPKDPVTRHKWSKRIPRNDKELSAKSKICALHFEEDMILKDFVHVINGAEVRMPRDRWVLNENAFPTQYPHLPQHYSKRVSCKRKPLNRSKTNEELPIKKPSPLPSLEKFIVPAVIESEKDVSWDWLSTFNLPRHWNRLDSSNENNSSEEITFFFCKGAQENWVYLKWSKDNIATEKPKIFVRCAEVLNSTLLNEYRRNRKGISSLLDKISSSLMCPGFNADSTYGAAYDTKIGKRYLKSMTVIGDHVYSKRCSAFVIGTTDEACMPCKNLLMQLRKRNHQKQNQTRVNERLRKKVNTLLHVVKQLQVENSTISETALEEQLNLLPARQQEAVRECFRQCKTGRNSHGYTQRWLLECLLMKAKSTALYTYIRDNKILAVPSPRTLNNYIAGIGTTCGLSSSTLQCLNKSLIQSVESKECGTSKYQLIDGCSESEDIEIEIEIAIDENQEDDENHDDTELSLEPKIEVIQTHDGTDFESENTAFLLKFHT
ncbi:hypothetical protein CHUAL_006959 [Chamberlinius hualienensis]